MLHGDLAAVPRAFPDIDLAVRIHHLARGERYSSTVPDADPSARR